MPSSNKHCNPNGIQITGFRKTERNSISRAPGGGLYTWYDRLGFIDRDVVSGKQYTYTASEGSTSCMMGTCPHTAGSFLNRGFFRSISEASEDDQATFQGEYQLVVPRYAVVNEYIHDDTSILDGRWLHANTLSPPDGDTKGQAIGVWLFQSSPRILSIIAREKLSQGRNDILVGYQIILDRTLEEGDVGEIAKEGDAEDAEVIVEKMEAKKEVEVERDADSGVEEVRVEEEVEIEVKESIKSRPDSGKHERVWVGPFRLVADTRLIDGVTGSAAFLLTNFDEENLFHLLVPREDEVSRESRIEYFTNNSGSILEPWTYVATLQPPSDDPETKITAVTFVQSSQGKFEAVAHVTPPNEGDNYLVGYELDAVNNQKDWSPPFRLVADTDTIDRVTGSPTIIESDFGEEDRFHLFAPHDAVTIQYTLAVGSFSNGQWKSFATLNPFQNLPVTAVSLVENQVGGFEAVTRVQRPEGDEVVVGYELQPGATQWSDGVALNADDGPILAGKPTPPVDTLPTNSIS